MPAFPFCLHSSSVISCRIKASHPIFMLTTPTFICPTQLLPWTPVPIYSCLFDISKVSHRSHLSKWLLILLIAQARNLAVTLDYPLPLTLMSNPAVIPGGSTVKMSPDFHHLTASILVQATILSHPDYSNGLTGLRSCLPSAKNPKAPREGALPSPLCPNLVFSLLALSSHTALPHVPLNTPVEFLL